MKFELEYVENLMKMMSDSTLTELELDDGEKRVILKKEKEVLTAAVPQTYAAAPAPQVAPAMTEKSEPVAEVKKGKALTSPMVGTFYKSPTPDSAAFVQIGSSVAQGEVVCIIEAMKLMNEIESEFSGKVLEICVESGQPVEYGQVLMYIE